MDVGIRDLKAHLSEFIERAAAGETIRVTERGRPKALLGPLPGMVDLERGTEEGWLVPGEARPPDTGRRRHQGATSIAEILSEDRGA